MPTKKKNVKHMICAFEKDGSMGCVYDADIVDEPFMGFIHDSINKLADIWFEYVKVSKEAKVKVKSIGIVIKI